MTSPTLSSLLVEYDRALAYTGDLVADLTEAETHWRPDRESSAIGWHLGHQAAVAHYLVRNLTAAEPRLDDDFERLADSATPEPDRGELPALDRIQTFRAEVAERVRSGVAAIDDGRVGAPAQLRVIAGTLMVALINHEYQHDKWIGEVRVEAHGRDLPPAPTSELLTTLDGYLILDPA